MPRRRPLARCRRARAPPPPPAGSDPPPTAPPPRPNCPPAAPLRFSVVYLIRRRLPFRMKQTRACRRVRYFGHGDVWYIPFAFVWLVHPLGIIPLSSCGWCTLTSGEELTWGGRRQSSSHRFKWRLDAQLLVPFVYWGHMRLAKLSIHNNHNRVLKWVVHLRNALSKGLQGLVTSPRVDSQKVLRLQFNSRQSSTVDTGIPFSARWGVEFILAVVGTGGPRTAFRIFYQIFDVYSLPTDCHTASRPSTPGLGRVTRRWARERRAAVASVR
eukprot:1190413-Prorocentrum_minimum.AAC.1